MTRRQSLKLLGELLLDRSNVKIMMQVGWGKEGRKDRKKERSRACNPGVLWLKARPPLLLVCCTHGKQGHLRVQVQQHTSCPAFRPLLHPVCSCSM